jgi:hypothetical protein
MLHMFAPRVRCYASVASVCLCVCGSLLYNVMDSPCSMSWLRPASRAGWLCNSRLAFLVVAATYDAVMTYLPFRTFHDAMSISEMAKAVEMQPCVRVSGTYWRPCCNPVSGPWGPADLLVFHW